MLVGITHYVFNSFAIIFICLRAIAEEENASASTSSIMLWKAGSMTRARSEDKLNR